MSDPRHDILQDLKRVASELNHAPSYTEYIQQQKGHFSERQIRKYFKNFTGALMAAGLQTVIEKSPNREKFKYAPKKIESFVIHERDLAGMFQAAGNPEVLKWSLQPDTHLEDRPDRGHCERAVAVMMKFLNYYDPHGHLIGGDLLDMGPISPWGAESFEPRRFVPMMLKGREHLAEIRSATPKTLFWEYLEGNHEDWLKQFMLAGQNPIFFDGMEELGMDLSVPGLLHLEGFGYNYTPVNEFLKLGNVHLTHGLYTGQNHAKKHLQYLKDNIIYFHTHDTDSADDTSLRGTLYSQSGGCLSQLNAPFLRGKINNWSNALTTLEIHRDGTFNKSVHIIKNGVMSYNGKVFKA